MWHFLKGEEGSLPIEGEVREGDPMNNAGGGGEIESFRRGATEEEEADRTHLYLRRCPHMTHNSLVRCHMLCGIFYAVYCHRGTTRGYN